MYGLTEFQCTVSDLFAVKQNYQKLPQEIQTRGCFCTTIKEIRLEIVFMKTTIGNKEVAPTLFPQYPFFAKIRSNSFDSVPLATLHFAILLHHIRHTGTSAYCRSTSSSSIVAKFSDLVIGCSLLPVGNPIS